MPTVDCWIPHGATHRLRRNAPLMTPLQVCLRCGRDDCSAAGLGDYARFEGGCSKGYLVRDMTDVRCYLCFRAGHLCCRETPLVRPVCIESSLLRSCCTSALVFHAMKRCCVGFSPLVLGCKGQQQLIRHVVIFDVVSNSTLTVLKTTCRLCICQLKSSLRCRRYLPSRLATTAAPRVIPETRARRSVSLTAHVPAPN